MTLANLGRRLARIGLASALTCLLSACWMSEKPLIGAAGAEAIPFAGTYTYRSDGEDALQTAMISATGERTYELTDDKPENRTAAAFVALGGDWFLMEGETRSDEEGAAPFYLYQIIRRVDGDLYFYWPDCDQVAGSFKGMKREKGEIESCNFGQLDGLKAMAAAWIAKFGKGDIAGEPVILRRATAP